jgi:hypothetical protein
MNLSEENILTDEIIYEDINILIRSISLTRGKFLERRREIRKTLVIAALDQFQEEDIFDIADISANIERVGKCKIDTNEIIAVVTDYQTDGVIEHIEGYKYKIRKKIDLPGFEILSEPVWKEFSLILKKKNPNYDPYIHKNAKVIFENILLKILTRYALSKPLENEIDYIPIDDIKSVIDKEIADKNIEKNFGKKYSDILLEYFSSDEKELLACIVNCYFWFIDLNLLSFEKDLKSIDFCKELNFLLIDTNFIVTILCQTDSRYPLSTSLIDFCKDSQIKVYYTDITKDEVWNLINASKNAMKLNPFHQYVDNQFIDDYRNLNRLNGLHYSEYIVFLNNWVNFVNSKYNIQLLPTIFSANRDEKDYDYIKNTLPMLYDIQLQERIKRDVDYKLRKRSESTYSHDAHCISLISHIKKNLKTYELVGKLGPWFLTYDSLLSDLNNHYFRKYDEFGYVIQPRIVLNYFLAFMKIDYNEKDIESIASALLKYTVRNPRHSFSISDYAKELAVKIGTTEDNADVLNDILVKMPLHYEFERALDQGNIPEAEKIVCDFINHENFERILSEMTETKRKDLEKDARIKELALKLKDANDELIREKAAREALEKSSTQNITIYIPSISGFEDQVSTKISELIEKLQQANAFSNDEFPKPPKEINKATARPWIEKIKAAAETTSLISDATNIIQLISQILSFLPK